jgi:crotonobetainyl-CoA:carnitine CoA-transferase CaiB-like acyl-CoA transferase
MPCACVLFELPGFVGLCLEAFRFCAEMGETLIVEGRGLEKLPRPDCDFSFGFGDALGKGSGCFGGLDCLGCCFLDLGVAQDAQHLRALVQDADVFSQGYRPGMIDKLGFGPEDLAALRPGIIYTSISCYGADGPFSHRAGWEQVAQTMTGICHDNHPQRPALLPAAACDYTTGYLAAYGVMLALARRATEGGSWHVRVSLCQSGMFIYRQGQVSQPVTGLDLSSDELDAMRLRSDPPHLGPLRHLGPILKMSETPAHWTRPTPRLGADAPRWP